MHPQPVDITVSNVRDELWRASRPDSPAPGPSALAGSLFHKTASGLLSGPAAWQVKLTEESLGDHEALRRHAYEKILGPQLARHEAALQNSGSETLWLWQAVGEACEWLCRILNAAREQKWIRYDAELGAWSGTDRLIASEQPISREFHQPNWRAPVRISGIPDAILRDPLTERWCCLEFKLNDGAEPVDLCQAALYL